MQNLRLDQKIVKYPLARPYGKHWTKSEQLRGETVTNHPFVQYFIPRVVAINQQYFFKNKRYLNLIKCIKFINCPRRIHRAANSWQPFEFSPPPPSPPPQGLGRGVDSFAPPLDVGKGTGRVTAWPARNFQISL